VSSHVALLIELSVTAAQVKPFHLTTALWHQLRRSVFLSTAPNGRQRRVHRSDRRSPFLVPHFVTFITFPPGDGVSHSPNLPSSLVSERTEISLCVCSNKQVTRASFENEAFPSLLHVVRVRDLNRNCFASVSCCGV
jgi:hypothetical protein